jgi:hypothetical protein
VPGVEQQLGEAPGLGVVPGTARGGTRVGGGDGRREVDDNAGKQSRRRG